MIAKEKRTVFPGWRALEECERISRGDRFVLISGGLKINNPDSSSEADTSIGEYCGQYLMLNNNFWVYRKDSGPPRPRRMAMNPAFSQQLPLP